MRQGTIGGLAGTTITDIRTGVAVAGGIATGIIGKTA